MNVGAGGQLHTSSCRLIGCIPRPAPRGTASLARSGSRHTWQTQESSKRCRCNAKKSKRRRREESFEERPADPEPQAFPDEDLGASLAEQTDAADTTGEVYEEGVDQDIPQYEQTQGVAPPQPPPQSGPSDTVKLGGLALGAVALIAAIAFAVKRFASRKLPDVEKVTLEHRCDCHVL